MKFRMLTIVFFLCAVFSGTAAGAVDLKGKILVYNFQNANKNISYGYYSYIIPDSITTELKKSPQYDVRSMPVAMEYADSSMPEKEYTNYLRLLADRGKEFNADFIVTGSYQIEDRKIVIKTQIYDVNEQEIKDIHESSEELGALLLVIIDQLSEKINSELQKGLEVKKAKAAVSPFTPFYNSISGFTFGFTYGTATLYGDWSDVYTEKTDMVTLFLRYGLANFEYFSKSPIFKDITISAEYDYASFNNQEGSSGSQKTYQDIRDATLNAAYPLLFTPRFGLEFQAGGGLAFTKIEVIMEAAGGPGEILASEKSMDPIVSVSAAALYLIDHFRFSAGISFKRIFYSDTPMDMSVIFFGAGWTI